MDKEIIPNHVGIIMDGNGRWAKEKGLQRSNGHKAGSKNLKKLANYIFERGVKYLSVFAFSTENFNRDKEEVDYLMKLLKYCFTHEFNDLLTKGIKVVFSGRSKPLNEDILQVMKEMEEKTKDNKNGVFNICINYGSNYEILDMTKQICEKVLANKIRIEDIDLKTLNENLYQDLPMLDLVIRTSGELRISNFMLLQSSYAEYYFPTTYFPDFNAKEFDKAITLYNKRDRRFGGIKK